jgi:hypothetical protein
VNSILIDRSKLSKTSITETTVNEKLVNLKATSRLDQPEAGLPLGLDEDDENVRIKRSTGGKRVWSVSERNVFVRTLAAHSGSAVSVAIETFASRSQMSERSLFL